MRYAIAVETGNDTTESPGYELTPRSWTNFKGSHEEAGEHLAQVTHVRVAELGGILSEHIAPIAPLLVVGNGSLPDRLQIRIVEEQTTEPDLARRPVTDSVLWSGDQRAVEVGAQHAHKFQHRQMRQLLVMYAVTPNVLVDCKVDTV